VLNRRELIQGGAAAGLVLMFGRVSLARADDAEEPYLHRAHWTGRVGESFGTLTLLSVSDVNERLAGRDDAFRLLFSGHAIEGVTDFGLFVAPVGAEGNRFEAIIDRSIPLPRHAPTPPTAPAPPAPDPPVARTSSVTPKKGVTRLKPVKHKKLSRKARRRRKKMMRQLARKFH
jgi:hypothetical protein